MIVILILPFLLASTPLENELLEEGMSSQSRQAQEARAVATEVEQANSELADVKQVGSMRDWWCVSGKREKRVRESLHEFDVCVGFLRFALAAGHASWWESAGKAQRIHLALTGDLEARRSDPGAAIQGAADSFGSRVVFALIATHSRFLSFVVASMLDSCESCFIIVMLVP